MASTPRPCQPRGGVHGPSTLTLPAEGGAQLQFPTFQAKGSTPTLPADGEACMSPALLPSQPPGQLHWPPSQMSKLMLGEETGV